jgi:ABC-type molybdate transport system permease subunit
LVFSFVFVNILFNTIRNTFGRVLTLLVAMGTGITSKEQQKQLRGSTWKIAVLSIIFAASNIVYLIAVYINRTRPLTPHMQLAVSLPLSLVNTVFFFWIVNALETTKKYLKEHGQAFKFDIMRRFTGILIGAYIICVLAAFGEIYFKFSYSERDEFWRLEWLVEASWHIIFSLFLCSVMALMRPAENSKMLALVEELGETERVT